MTAQDDDGAGVGKTLHRAFGYEPPLTLNAGAIARQGARVLRRRRAGMVGGVVLAVAVLTAGVAVGVPRLAGTVGAADRSAVQVPGCGVVVSTDDPAVTAWRDGSTASPAAAPSSPPAAEAESSSSEDQTLSSTTFAAATAGSTAAADAGRPAPAWLTTGKAARMAAAFSAAIPTGVRLSAADASAQAGPLPFAAGSGEAGGGVVVSAGSARAFLTIDVQMWDKGAPPCTANLAHRYINGDGSITDVIDDPGSSQSGHYMLAESYRPDGTLVNVGLNNSGGIVPPTATLPLTVEQLAAIAAVPALAITAP